MAGARASLQVWLSAVILLAALHHAAPSVFVARTLAFSRSSAGRKSGSPGGSPSRPLLPTRKLTLKRTDAFQHDLSTLSADAGGSTADGWCCGDSSRQPSPLPKGRRCKLARTDRPQSVDLAPVLALPAD
eukprot:Tamp_31215.p2 GENE.Tamp_31215~~Tamp_31215.p2  ORF type:complete len:130 (+),score=9.87 Tamp_31215:115-504(+)